MKSKDDPVYFKEKMYKVYYTKLDGSANSVSFNQDQMVDALESANNLRNTGFTFVSIVSENSNQVGKMGVAAVENGLLPDGTDYEWRKRR